MSNLSRKAVARYIAQAWVEKLVPRRELVAQMAAYLVESRKTKEADLLVSDIKAAIESDYGVVVAEVVSARELSSSLSKEVADFVKRKTGAKKVVVSESVDESLIGGFIATTPSETFDVSVRSKLNNLKA